MKDKRGQLKVALVHDYLREYGGAERVLEALHQVYPQAPVYVAFVDQTALGMHWKKFKDWDIRQSWITKVPLYKKIFSPLRVLAPQFFRSFDMSEYDVIVSSSNMYFAKAVEKRKDDVGGRAAVHISYCHTPPRALYGYNTQTQWKKNIITRIVGTLINHYLRIVDYYVSQKVDYFVANSKEVQKRIKKFYRRDAKVIYPPVEIGQTAKTTKYSSNKEALPYYLYVGRLAFAKHPELAIEACEKLGVCLKVAGDGGMFNKLREQSRNCSNIELLGAVSDAQLEELYAGAQALLYPVEDEDFGIVPVEAMMHGVPVIAHKSGGPKETVIGLDSGKEPTGVFFDELTLESLVAAITKFEKNKKRFDKNEIRKWAKRFGKDRFLDEIEKFITQVSF